MDFITIDSIALPTPFNGGYSISRSDLDSENSNRSQSGYLRRQRIRSGIYKLEITWRVKQSELKTITDAIEPTEFSCTFYDGTTNSYKTCTMYASDRSASLVLRDSTDSNSIWDLTVSLIEY